MVAFVCLLIGWLVSLMPGMILHEHEVGWLFCGFVVLLVCCNAMPKKYLTTIMECCFFPSCCCLGPRYFGGLHFEKTTRGAQKQRGPEEHKTRGEQNHKEKLDQSEGIENLRISASSCPQLEVVETTPQIASLVACQLMAYQHRPDCHL